MRSGREHTGLIFPNLSGHCSHDGGTYLPLAFRRRSSAIDEEGGNANLMEFDRSLIRQRNEELLQEVRIGRLEKRLSANRAAQVVRKDLAVHRARVGPMKTVRDATAVY